METKTKIIKKYCKKNKIRLIDIKISKIKSIKGLPKLKN